LSRQIRVLVGLAVLGVLASCSSALAGMADRIGATFGLMSEDFIKTFTPLEALVVGFEDGAALKRGAEGRAEQPGGCDDAGSAGHDLTDPAPGNAWAECLHL